MKKGLSFLLFILILLGAYFFRNDIYQIYFDYFVPIEKKVSTLEKNKYFRDYEFKYVQNINNFIPEKKEDIKNIYYTIANSGMNNFTFYCPKEYENCINDVNDIANDQITVSNINNFIHPYNSFKTIKTEVESTGKINIEIEKVYDDEMIIILNYKISEVLEQIIKENDTTEQKVKKIHDYIINNTKYDKERSDSKIVKYKSDNAYGALIEHHALCSGYTDAMMLFLEELGIENIKISTENHIWNYVKINNEWLHLDLTWDDPVSEDGKDILDSSYFLITDSQLKNIEKNEHNYDESVYKN